MGAYLNVCRHRGSRLVSADLWVALLLIPAGMDLFFERGPFAWDGMLAFWMFVVVFCVCFLLMFNEVRKAIHRQSAEAQQIDTGPIRRQIRNFKPSF